MTIYEVREKESKCWTEIKDSDIYAAAEQYAELIDDENFLSGDGNCVEVEIRELGSEKTRIFDLSANISINYNASEIE